jgi:hypothetical protein
LSAAFPVQASTNWWSTSRPPGHSASKYRPRCSPAPVRCNIGGAAMCKASIAAVVLALGIVSLVQEGTNAMVALPAGLRPASTRPAVETVALRKSVTVTRHVAVRHRGVSVRARHIAVRHRGVTRTRHVAARTSRHRGQNPARRISTSRCRSPQDPCRSGQAWRCGREIHCGREARQAVGPATLLRGSL